MYGSCPLTRGDSLINLFEIAPYKKTSLFQAFASMNKHENPGGCERHKTCLYSKQTDILWNICVAGRDLVCLALTVIWAKVRMWERLRHLVLCAACSPFERLAAKLHPSLRASEHVCVLVCFYLCVCVCVSAFKERSELQVDCTHLAVRRFFPHFKPEAPVRIVGLSLLVCVHVCVQRVKRL